MDEELYQDPRFVAVRRLYTISGVPIKKNVSFLVRVYANTVKVCGWLTSLSLFMEVYMNLDDTEYIMAIARPGVAMLNALWTQLFIR